MNDYDVVISFLILFEFCCILPYPFYPLPTDFSRIFKRNRRTTICRPIKQSNSLTTQQPNSLFFHRPIVSNNKSSIYFHPLNHFQSNNSNNKSNNHRNDSYITTTTTATATANRRRKSIVSDFIIVFDLVSMLNDTIH